MTFPYFHVEAFADRPFRGNPAGVCLLEKELDPELMQQIANETNLAVTAFVRRLRTGESLREFERQGDRGAPQFRLQWFTPTLELPLCGHGTLATAHILWEQGWLRREEEAVFDTQGGPLTVCHLPDGWIELDFPVFGSSPAQLPPEWSGLFPHPLCVLLTNKRYLIELDGVEKVSGFIPDFEKLKAHNVIITSRAEARQADAGRANTPRPNVPRAQAGHNSEDASFDFVSRFFAGPVGVPEDSVTGSAHCSLAPYWSEKLGKKEMLAYQSSARGGMVKVRLENDRVLLAGKAITLIKGHMGLCPGIPT